MFANVIRQAVCVFAFVLMAGFATDAVAQTLTKKSVTFECPELVQTSDIQGFVEYGTPGVNPITFSPTFTITSTTGPFPATAYVLMGAYQNKFTLQNNVTSTVGVYSRCRFQKKIAGVYVNLGAPNSPTMPVATTPANVQ